MIKVSLWIALALPLVCMATVAAAQGPGNGDDEVAIKNVIVQMTEGFNKHDAEASTRMYQPDADFVSVRGEMGLGRRKDTTPYFRNQSEDRGTQNRGSSNPIYPARRRPGPRDK